MKKISKLFLNLFFIAIFLFSIIIQSLAIQVYKINIENDIYSAIPSDNFILLDYKILPNFKLAIFYQDKQENNLNQIFILLLDLKNKNVIKTIKTDLVRYKESVVDKNGNIFILSWKPIDLYFLDMEKLNLYKFYDNSLPQNGEEKFIFTLDSKLILSSKNEVFAKMDLKKEKNFSEDEVICKLNIVDNKLNIEPWFSSYKLSRFFKGPYTININYPENAIILDIKQENLYNFNPQSYSKQIDISKHIKEYDFKCKHVFDINNNKMLLSINNGYENNLVIVDINNPKDIIYINEKKFIDTKFLNENQIIYNTIEKNKDINFYIFDIQSKKVENISSKIQELTKGSKKIIGSKIGIINETTFFTFNKNEIFVINLK